MGGRKVETLALATAHTSGTVGAWVPRASKPSDRLGSGVLCSAKLTVEGETIECESPLTTRLRGGIDTLERPIGEYLCETCGIVFVAVTVSLGAHIAFDQVDASDGHNDNMLPEIINLATAIRRGEKSYKDRMAAKRVASQMDAFALARRFASR